jgi:hypothetical protein
MSGSVLARQEAEQETGTEKPAPPSLDMNDDEVSGLARRLGWKPQNEYRGPPDRWVDARAFVETADRNPAVMWSNLQTLDKRHATLEREARETKTKLEQAVTLISDLTEQSRTIGQRAYDRARRDLIAEREAAVEAGDKVAFAKVDGELADLEKSKPQPKAAATSPPQNNQPPPPPQEVQDWGRQNPWFYSDLELQGEANALHMTLLNSRPDLSVADNLATVSRTIKALHPEKFPNRAAATPPKQANGHDDGEDPPVGERPSAVSRATPGRPKRDFNSVPRESKAQFNRYKEMIGRKDGAKPLTEAEWAANYWDQFPEDGT